MKSQKAPLIRGLGQYALTISFPHFPVADAFEFLTQIVDQTDEELKRMGRMQVFQHVFKGTFSDMKLCYDCDHR